MIHLRGWWEPELRRMNLNGMSFEKKIASHFNVGHRNASMQWIRCLWNRLLRDCMQPTTNETRGLVWGGRPKATTDKWNGGNKGREVQLGIGHNIPWDVWWQRRHGWQCVVGRNGDGCQPRLWAWATPLSGDGMMKGRRFVWAGG